MGYLTGSVLDRPLVVDLDGTLIKSDLLVETLFSLLATHPGKALAALLTLRFGKAALKARLADDAVLELDTLPFDGEVLAFLRAEKAKGRRIYLASAADRRLVDAVAAHLGLFDGAFGSDGSLNLSGKRKAELLCREFGEAGFDYVGNAQADVPVWKCCAQPIAANAPLALLRRLKRTRPELMVLNGERPRLADYAKALRIHQWLKNTLIFVPLLASHMLTVEAVAQALLAFVAFSLCASSVYLLNDLLDLANDREHHSKRHRPLASGAVPLLHGVALAPSLLLAALTLGLTSLDFLAVLGAYYVTTMAYSLALKRRMLIDVMALSVLYTLRIFAGGIAVGAAISPWLMGFSIFLFLCLALVKRYAELENCSRLGKRMPRGRGYVVADAPMLGSLGAAAGYGAIVVLALYINSAEVLALYFAPEYLWLVCLLLLYWVSRVLMIAHRGEMHDDPVIFAMKDRISLVTGAAVVAVVLASI
ncbi:MAG: UbiA family prenyltransferase [Alphaproteobacteria bacterium]|nr:UbiA family prenyltransferase [Alphaproteobacteria bacterium]